MSREQADDQVLPTLKGQSNKLKPYWSSKADSKPNICLWRKQAYEAKPVQYL